MIAAFGRYPVRAIVGLLVLIACSGDAEPAPGMAASVGDHVLTVEQLAEVLVLAQPFPLEVDPALELVRHWALSAAVATAFAAGDSLNGKTAVDAATWIARREAVLALEREDRLGPPPTVGDPELAREVFDRGELRLFAHVLRRVGPETPPAERALQRRTAERILADLVAGGGWAAAVAQSQADETRALGGVLGLFGPGELPGELDRAGVRLEPGSVSSVMETVDGFHLLYRPTFAEVGAIYADRLGSRMLAEADAASADAALAAAGFRVVEGAGAVVRRVAAAPADWFDREAALASWSGGALRAATFARYLAALEAGERQGLASADDRSTTALLNELGYRELRMAEAVARGLALDSVTAQELAERHRSDLEAWREAVTGQGALGVHLREVAARRTARPSLGPVLAAELLSTARLGRDAAAAAVDRARTLIVAAMDGAERTGSVPVAAVTETALGRPLPGIGDGGRGRFLLGRALFERVATPDEGLGPLFNADRCVSCHDDPVVGGGGLSIPVRKATAFIAGRCDLLPAHGGDNLQARATPMALAAGLAPETRPDDATAFAQVVAPPLFGLGLLEAVPDETVLALEDPEDLDGDGVSGRAPRLADGRIARFGRKGDAADVRGFVEQALRTELGLTTPERPTEERAGGSPIPGSADPAEEPEMDERGMDLLTEYVRYLAPPAPELLPAGVVRDSVERGRVIFDRTGCAACHVAELRASQAAEPPLANLRVPAYTDLLLHDLGAGDIGGAREDLCGYDALPGEYRTAPLWGLRHRSRFLHDGRAASVEEAVLAHGGEAARARAAFHDLIERDRADLVRFLLSL